MLPSDHQNILVCSLNLKHQLQLQAHFKTRFYCYVNAKIFLFLFLCLNLNQLEQFLFCQRKFQSQIFAREFEGAQIVCQTQLATFLVGLQSPGSHINNRHSLPNNGKMLKLLYIWTLHFSHFFPSCFPNFHVVRTVVSITFSENSKTFTTSYL